MVGVVALNDVARSRRESFDALETDLTAEEAGAVWVEACIQPCVDESRRDEHLPGEGFVSVCENGSSVSTTFSPRAADVVKA
jgi:hypothetical protein